MYNFSPRKRTRRVWHTRETLENHMPQRQNDNGRSVSTVVLKCSSTPSLGRPPVIQL